MGLSDTTYPGTAYTLLRVMHLGMMRTSYDTVAPARKSSSVYPSDLLVAVAKYMLTTSDAGWEYIAVRIADTTVGASGGARRGGNRVAGEGWLSRSGIVIGRVEAALDGMSMFYDRIRPTDRDDLPRNCCIALMQRNTLRRLRTICDDGVVFCITPSSRGGRSWFTDIPNVIGKSQIMWYILVKEFLTLARDTKSKLGKNRRETRETNHAQQQRDVYLYTCVIAWWREIHERVYGDLVQYAREKYISLQPN